MKKYLILVFIIVSTGLHLEESRPLLGIKEINAFDNGDLCPNASSDKFLHRFILVDVSGGLRSDQIELIKRLVLSKSQLEELKPWDKLSIMLLGLNNPTEVRPIFSKCRPRSGNPRSPYKEDQPRRLYENAAELKAVYKIFEKGVEEAINQITNAVPTDDRVGSPLFGQIKEISRLPDLDFTKSSGYETRELIIISDLMQNTTKIPFYDLCKKKCQSWEKFKNNSRHRIWVKSAMPSDFGQGLAVDLIYLNTHRDKNLDKGVVEFWMEYMQEAKVPFRNFEIESDFGR